MEWRLALLLFLGFIMEYGSVPHHFHFVKIKKTWTEAQSYCREKYTDLATIDNMKDMEMMMDDADGYERMAWIGLYQTTDTSWKWSLADEGFYGPGESNFTAWSDKEPNGGDGEECVEMIGTGRWNDKPCDTKLLFICYDDKIEYKDRGKESYVLVNKKKPWRNAQSYCREHHTDLVSVRNKEENQLIREKAEGKAVWIGLFRDKWMWSDHRSSSFRYWRPGIPDNSGTDNCAVTWLRQKDNGKWGDRKCDEQYPFFCRTVFLSDKLLLVMKNLNWTEARHYCRAHHMDLVSVLTEEIQGWVMALAKKASTEHVWLGLRFLCLQEVWRWVSGEAVCWENWADDCVSEDVCGDESAGAMQSRGDQQWVSLRDSTRLNFICTTNKGEPVPAIGQE